MMLINIIVCIVSLLSLLYFRRQIKRQKQAFLTVLSNATVPIVEDMVRESSVAGKAEIKLKYEPRDLRKYYDDVKKKGNFPWQFTKEDRNA